MNACQNHKSPNEKHESVSRACKSNQKKSIPTFNQMVRCDIKIDRALALSNAGGDQFYNAQTASLGA